MTQQPSSPERELSFFDRLRRNFSGEILTDIFSRGRYSTDASHYQIVPQGIVLPKSAEDLQAVVATAREEGVPLLPRGGGTSQSGQTVGDAIVIDFSKYMRNTIEVDAENRRCVTEPGIVLDDLNRQLAPTGLWFPVDVSTSSRATIGGMVGNNSCGTRSLRYGIMKDNVTSLQGILADGSEATFGPVARDVFLPNTSSRIGDLKKVLTEIGESNSDTISTMFPEVSRRVGGYNLDALTRSDDHRNLAELLIGSEGTLALTREVELKLAPRPRNKALGICHFPTFRSAMEAAQHIVKLGPVAVETVDLTLINLARSIPMFRSVIERFVRGEPEALLLTEFAEDDQAENLQRLELLDELMGDIGHPNSVVKVQDSDSQAEFWEVRKSGLNIMMSMKTEGKPVSFIEDCAVPLENLADYTEQLTAVFEKYGTRGTWYAHASVGCLHVRPILNLKRGEDTRIMRQIAEEAFEFVSLYKGSHSGEHGDGLVRSEFHEKMYGRQAVRLFEEVKAEFDPTGLLNPGKIVKPEPMDKRELFRYPPGYEFEDLDTVLDWSEYSGAAGGFQGAVEMCNNNGACRKFDHNVMCPSYRITRDEKHVTRGRANTLRLALSGQLGPDAFVSEDMRETMELCVSCKGCKRECPTGVDMAKMKIEFLHAWAQKHGITLHQKIIANLPNFAPWLSKLGFFLNLRDKLPGLKTLSEKLLHFSARRKLPAWSRRPYLNTQSMGPEDGPEVLLFVDTFNRYFDPGIVESAVYCLTQLGRRVHFLPYHPRRVLCCGRTHLSVGQVEAARKQARDLVAALKPFLDRGVPVVGLEPSCLFTLKDEFLSLLKEQEIDGLVENIFMFEDIVLQILEDENIRLATKDSVTEIRIHGHCHQKAFAAMSGVQKLFLHIDGVNSQIISTSCCGMAGDFGYHADTYESSVEMAELSLLPAVREMDENMPLLADGFSCRHQIEHGTGRIPLHVAQYLENIIRQAPLRQD